MISFGVVEIVTVVMSNGLNVDSGWLVGFFPASSCSVAKNVVFPMSTFEHLWICIEFYSSLLSCVGSLGSAYQRAGDIR